MKSDKYFLIIAYNGNRYHGWQNQKDGLSVQEVLEGILTNVIGTEIPIHGCGRTDTGVHASNYVAHAILPFVPPDFLFKLNKQLPEQIAVKQIMPMHPDAHAQKDAEMRTYTYFIHTHKDPYLSEFSTWYPNLELDLNKMERACQTIPKARDFKNFCLNPKKHKSTLCSVKKVEFFVHPNQKRIAIRFSGDHFLRSMIRLLVGELIEVGSGETTLAQFEDYLQLRRIKPKHNKAYPQGLHLTAVQYLYFKTELPERPF